MVLVNIALVGQADDLSLEPQTCVKAKHNSTIPCNPRVPPRVRQTETLLKLSWLTRWRRSALKHDAKARTNTRSLSSNLHIQTMVHLHPL